MLLLLVGTTISRCLQSEYVGVETAGKPVQAGGKGVQGGHITPITQRWKRER